MRSTRRLFLLSAGAAAAAPRQTGDIVKFQDPRTGIEVWQVSAGAGMSNACYFEAQAFTGDDRFVTYGSDRTGSWQLYRVDLKTGKTSQITRSKALVNLSFSMHPDGRRLLYLDGDRLTQAEVSTGRETVLIELGRAMGAMKFSAGRSFSSDGRYTTVAWSEAGRKYGIALVDLQAGKIEKTVEVRNGTGGHMLICPADTNLVTYCCEPDRQNNMSLPPEERARTMIADFRTGKSRAFLTMPVGFRATHEYWGPGGNRFYFHKKKVPGWVPASICSMKRDGTDWRTHITSDYMLGHSMITEDSRYIVSDVQKPKDNPLILVDLRSGAERILCWPDSTVTAGHPKGAHVHPSFSRSGRYIVYTSDRTGTAQVYVVPAPRG